MYDWLSDALSDSSSLITANRRLARTLREEFGAQRAASGQQAWRSPRIEAWPDWLATVVAGAAGQETLPTRISAHQSQWLWERCLRREVDESVTNVAGLVRLSRDTWQRLADWQVPVTEIARAALNADQRMFAAAVGRYLALLQREGWVDDAGLAELVVELIDTRRVALLSRYTFAGFNRQRPIDATLQAALEKNGAEVQRIAPAGIATSSATRTFDSPDAEIRSAGAWARRRVERQANASVAVVSTGLEQDADRFSRLFKEGFVPGWQCGPRALSDAVNVSYGRVLDAYPAIATALLLLRWLSDDLSSTDVALLLRSPLLGDGDLAGRSRLELRLRQKPDRRWSPSMFTAAMRGKGEGGDGTDWLARVATLTRRRRDLPQRASPAEWAVAFDEILRDTGWPGAAVQDSDEFQLINRWRELLNEFARLELVIPHMTLALALSRLRLLASETLFQSESRNARVSLIGPLEASGAEFDAVWITGLTAANWPAAGSPSVLISRGLQQRHDMPDATPEDTLGYAQRLLTRLAGCASEVVCSYALQDGDAEQTATSLLAEPPPPVATSSADPGWFATRFLACDPPIVIADAVPPMSPNEKVAGGASTIQRQLSEPISAFIVGRLGVRALYPQAEGVPAFMRGNIIHDALQQLYVDEPSSASIQEWQGDGLERRIDKAVDQAFARHERNSDDVLLQLMQIERSRVGELLHQFVQLDGARCEFQITGVEAPLNFVSGNVSLALRADRIDQFADGSIEILDYKTGAAKKLMRTREVANEIQLFVYACAIDEPVSALALVNIDSKNIAFSGAGRGYTDESLWPNLMQLERARIDMACRELQAGDVRTNIGQKVSEARALNLLSRFTELRRDG